VISKKEFTGLPNNSPLFKGGWGDQVVFLFPESPKSPIAKLLCTASAYP
jgi:hypothetical protein